VLDSLDPPLKPRLRGVLHGYAFVAAVGLGAALVVAADGLRETLAAAVFAGSVAAMFGVSALYHRPDWTAGPRRWLRRLDHATIYALIAGTYTPFGLLVLSGAWRIVVLSVVWSGAAAAIVLKLVWIDSPRWLAAALGIALGWVGVVAVHELVDGVGIAAVALMLAGGVLYSAGAVVYAVRRPDPVPAVFGFHELFHALVIAAVGCQYAAVAFFVLA
jgi:hemolysin III